MGRRLFELEIIVGQHSVAHDASLGAGLQVVVAVHWDRGSRARFRVTVDMMAPGNSSEVLATIFE